MDMLDEIPEETGRSVAQCAFNQLQQRPVVSSLIIGARAEKQLKQNRSYNK